MSLIDPSALSLSRLCMSIYVYVYVCVSFTWHDIRREWHSVEEFIDLLLSLREGGSIGSQLLHVDVVKRVSTIRDVRDVSRGVHARSRRGGGGGGGGERSRADIIDTAITAAAAALLLLLS